MIDGGDDLRRKATGAIGWVVVERWSSRLVSMAIFVVLARVLLPEYFGLISLASAITAILQVFVDSGMSRALVQRKELGPKDASTAFWTSMAVALVLGIALALVAPFVAATFGEPQLTPVLQALSLSLPISALSQTPAALLEREFGFKALSLRMLVGVACGGVVALPLAFLGLGVWALVAQVLVSAVASAVTLWASTDWRPTWQFSMDSLKSLWSVGISVLGADLLDAIQGNVDKLVIGAFFTPEQLGYYYLAQRLGIIVTDLVTSVFVRVSLTTFSRVQDDRARLNRIFRQMTFAAAAVCVPTFTLLAVLGPQIIPFVFGEGWEQSLPFLWILAPGWALGTVMYFDRSVLIATGSAASALWLALLQNAVGIGLVFALAPFGVYGIAFSRWARLVTWPVRLAVLRRRIGLDVWKYLSQVFRCVLAAVPVAAAILLLQQTPWASAPGAFWSFALPVGLAGLLVFAAVLWPLAGAENRMTIRKTGADIAARLALRSG